MIGLLALMSVVPFSSETLRRQLVATLSDRLDSEVELVDLRMRLLPRFRAEGVGLTLRHKRRHDVPPLVSVRTLSVEASVLSLLRRHVDLVTVGGLEIDIPPKNADKEQVASATGLAQRKVSREPSQRRSFDDVVIDHLISVDTKLVIIPREEKKAPKVWAIHSLHMRTVSFDRAIPFEALLTNAIPPGEIATRGILGPWRPDDPGTTTLEGTFTFARADLGVFKGISGILSAHGEFGGSLGRLGVHGETETPDFTVAVGGHPMPLHTDYHATVDGTNGDTLLDRIDARFANTSLVAKGRVIDQPGKDGRLVSLDVTMDGRLEDVLRLAVRVPKAPMTGTLKLTTKFALPPGNRDVVDKLRLDGQFAIARARFTEINIQQRIDELSRRSRGRSQAARPDRVVSGFLGHFKFGDGALAVQTMTFETPGTSVHLAGTYGLRSEMLDLKGTLLMEAKISETQRGFRRLLLKAVDPIFNKKGGGSAIPIKIEGKRSEPSFGLDKGRLFKRGFSS